MNQKFDKANSVLSRGYFFQWLVVILGFIFSVLSSLLFYGSDVRAWVMMGVTLVIGLFVTYMAYVVIGCFLAMLDQLIYMNEQVEHLRDEVMYLGNRESNLSVPTIKRESN